jgi:tripartite-type tricarboxylate transporter receptor subunit TctC
MRIIIGLLACAGLLAAPAAAQDKYPSKQVNLIVPFAPGGGNDLTARAIAPALQRALGQPVVVVNKAGAAGGIASQSVAIAPPDGYNILVSNTQAILLPATDKLFDRKPAFSKDDFQYVAMLSADPLLLWVQQDAPWKTFKDLVADAKAKDGAIVYSSGGLYGATHVPIEMFLKPTGIKMRHLPTGGGGPALTAVLGGNAAVVASFPAVAGPHAKAGKIRALATYGSKRHPDYPDVPTFKEQGVDIESEPWIGFLVPKATPEAVVKVLREATKKAAAEADYKEAMAKAGSGTRYMDQPEFTEYVKKDAAVLEAVVASMQRVQP